MQNLETCNVGRKVTPFLDNIQHSERYLVNILVQAMRPDTIYFVTGVNLEK